jgi:hypothetical protein
VSARDDPARAQDGCRGDAAVHLLGLLDERQSSEFLEHARSCALCSDDLAALSPAVDSLPGTVPQLPAPERTRRQVMAVVRSEASLMSAGSSRPVKARPPLGRWRRGPALALAGAGVLAAGVALGGLSTPFGGGTAQRGAVQRGAGIRVVSADVALPGASATLNQSAGHTWLAVSRMPEPAAGHVYEVWIERPGNKAPQPTTSLFAPTSAGAATVEVPIGQGTGTVMVTQEPLGGSPQPTGRVVIVAHVT